MASILKVNFRTFITFPLLCMSIWHDTKFILKLLILIRLVSHLWPSVTALIFSHTKKKLVTCFELCIVTEWHAQWRIKKKSIQRLFYFSQRRCLDCFLSFWKKREFILFLSKGPARHRWLVPHVMFLSVMSTMTSCLSLRKGNSQYITDIKTFLVY